MGLDHAGNAYRYYELLYSQHVNQQSGGLFVEIGCLLESGVADEIALDPELRARFLAEDFESGPRFSGLLYVEFGYWQLVECTFHDFIGRSALEKKANGPHRRKVTLALDAMHPFDRVLAGGKTWAYPLLTLAMVDESQSKPGTAVSLLWGEPGGGSSIPPVEQLCSRRAARKSPTHIATPLLTAIG